MKHVRSFDNFRKNKPVNEELLGGLINFFKKMWDKAIKDLEEMDNDPNKLKDWVVNNALNPKDDTNVFSNLIKEFQKKDKANDQDCLSLVDNMLDPKTGSLGEQGIGTLLSNKAFQGDKMKAKRAMLQFIIDTSRNKTIADGKVKFAGGPTDGKVDPKKKNIDLNDKTHLPELKKILIAQKEDEKKKKDETIKWVTTVLIPLIQSYVKAIREDDIKASMTKQGIEITSVEYKEGDQVVYLLKDKNKDDWDKLTDEQKKATNDAPTNQVVGVGKIQKINGDTYTIEYGDGKTTDKTKEEIIQKVGVDKVEGQEDLVNTLKDIKAKSPDSIKELDPIAKLYQDPVANKDKIDQIKKIVNPGGAGA